MHVSASALQNDHTGLPAGLDDPQRYTVAQAIEAAAGIAAPHLMADELAELLRAELEQYGGRAARVQHLLAILSGLHCARRVLPFRSRLLRHADPHVKSRAALMIGRASHNADWIARQLLDPDPRVQANAIESGWGIETEDMRGVLARAARSPHNRVAANALVGLYLLADISCVPRLLEMAERRQELFRISARWAMGETADARFLPYLTAAFRTDPPRSRNVTVRAIARIRRRLSAWEDAGALPVRIFDKQLADEGKRKLRLSVLSGRAEVPFEVSAVNFMIHDNSALVTQYTVQALPRPEVLLVGFVAPRISDPSDPYGLAVDQALAGCLAVKRDCDLWWMNRYIAEQTPDDPQAAARPALREDPAIARHLRANRGLFSAPDLIVKVTQGPWREETSANLRASLAKTAERISRVSGSRHLFVFADGEGYVSCQDLEALLRDRNAGNPAVHLISPKAGEYNHRLMQLCRRSGGEFIGLPPEALAAEVTAAYRGLLQRYEVTWPRMTRSGSGVVLRIVHPQGCAELVVDAE